MNVLAKFLLIVLLLTSTVIAQSIDGTFHIVWQGNQPLLADPQDDTLYFATQFGPNNDIEFKVMLNELKPGEFVAQIKSDSPGEIILHYDAASTHWVTIKKLEFSRKLVSQDVTNNIISFDNQIIQGGSTAGHIKLRLKKPSDAIWSLSLTEDETSSVSVELSGFTSKLGNITNSSNATVVQVMEGTVRKDTGELVQKGFVCMGEADKESCSIIVNGRYFLMFTNTTVPELSFRVNGIAVQNVQVQGNRADLVIKTSDLNFADGDEDGIPDQYDRCSKSELFTTDSQGCDCTQKICPSRTTCSSQKGESSCIPVSPRKCSLKDTCLHNKPEFCAQNEIASKCGLCGCPEGFTCLASGACGKISKDLVGSVCKDNDFYYSLANVNCPEGWIREDIARYLSIDVSGPILIEDLAQEEVDDAVGRATLCLKISDLGCAPKEQPYTCRFEELLEKNRGKAERILEDTIQNQLPAPGWEDIGEGMRAGAGALTGGLSEILGLFVDIELTPHVDLSQFKLREEYTCSPQLITTETPCIQMINNGPSDKKADVVFVGDGYLDSEEFFKEIKEIIDYEGIAEGTDKEGFFSVEPYKSMKTKFNVWAVNGKDKIRHEPTTRLGNEGSGNLPNEKDVNDLTQACGQRDFVFVLSKHNYRSFCYFGGKNPCYLSLADEPFKGRLLLHEAGHGIGSLGDEYALEAPALKNAPERVEALVTEIQTSMPNCKADEKIANEAWGTLVAPGNKLGFFKSCGGDCMPFCQDAIRPTLNSIMRHQSYKTGNEKCVSDKNCLGAPFDQYYEVSEREIRKTLENYEMSNPRQTLLAPEMLR